MRRRLRRFVQRIGRRTLLENSLTAAAFLGGLALVALGVAIIYFPAGLIVGGLQLVTGAALYSRNAS